MKDVVLGTVVLAMMAIPVAGEVREERSTGECCDAALTIRVYNYADVDGSTLPKAKEYAAAVLQAAGVALEWLDCFPLANGDRHPVCQQPAGPADVLLRISNSSKTGRDRLGPDLFGFAAPSRQTDPTYVTILYDRIQAMKSMREEQTLLLGVIMAHEIGHVLLGAGHSRDGIMRANANDSQLMKASRGQLLFTPDQAERVRTQTLVRNELVQEAGEPLRADPLAATRSVGVVR